MTKNITKLIINNPYDEPTQHWNYQRESRDFHINKGRRPAGYVTATQNAKGFDDPGIFVEIKQVNQIRLRVQAWREAVMWGLRASPNDCWNIGKIRKHTMNGGFSFASWRRLKPLSG